MIMEKKIVTFRTITPLFIKGKDPDYGEGMLLGDDSLVYIIDVDMLCEYLDGIGNGLVDKYVKYYYREVGHDDYVGFAMMYDVDITQHLNDCRPDNYDNMRESQRRAYHQIQGKPIDMVKYFNCIKKYKNRGSDMDPDRRSFEKYKSHALDFFLRLYDCLKGIKDLQSLSKGVVRLKDSGGSNKYFIQCYDKSYYIPGSSIKGAIRNALLWSIMKEDNNNKWLNKFVINSIDQVSSQKNPVFSKNNIVGDGNETIDEKSGFVRKIDSIIEKRVDYKSRWLKTENEPAVRDLFKAVKISDSDIISVNNIPCEVTAVCKDTSDGESLYRKRFSLNLHALPVGTVIKYSIELDLDLLDRLCGNDIPNCLRSIDNMLEAVINYYSEAFHNERRFFSKTSPRNLDPYQYCQITKDFYNTTRSQLFRLGWGGGLISKTQFMNLDEQYHLDDGKILNIRKLIRDKFTGNRRGNHENAAPKSRCLIAGGQYRGLPLGWCELTISPKI